MNLAISNIAWEQSKDEAVYGLMKEYGFDHIEIAPTRIFPVNPYTYLRRVSDWAKKMETKGIKPVSMQSIWYGRTENLFSSESEREKLKNYTKTAIDFAEAAGIGNLVFGCPKNRVIPDGVSADIAIPFFYELGEYARSHNATIGLEANPREYNTNFLNTTGDAIMFSERIVSDGIGINLDTGAMVSNGETVSVVKSFVNLISHVHISEPFLKPIVQRKLHREVLALLKESGYKGYVSIEMGKCDDISVIEGALKYLRELNDEL
ncbi:MAG: sugar phosphate isomerase/epimerase [Lachnospiraceae bacterium]|nr:sugar phosphate isomerase/epimerase [Lachnospiraceae bacterium]